MNSKTTWETQVWFEVLWKAVLSFLDIWKLLQFIILSILTPSMHAWKHQLGSAEVSLLIFVPGGKFHFC